MDDDGCLWIIGIVIVAAIIFGVVVPFVTAFWPWILTGVAVIGIAWGAFAYRSGKKQREQQRIAVEVQRKKKEQDRIAAEIQRDKDIAYAEQQLTLFAKWLTPAMVIDSNIWMNERYESFFGCMELSCVLKKYRIELFGVQFDEISNIKKAAPYGDPKNARARIAINRIESLQKVNLLRVVPISIDAKKGAYADPLIVKVLAQQSREGKNCTFFSDDKELRVRVRQHLSDFSEADWQIVEVENYLGTCEKIVKGFQLLSEKTKANKAVEATPLRSVPHL